MERITIAHLTKPFGLKGEIKGIFLTSFPEERFIIGEKYILQRSKDKEEKEVTLKSIRTSNNGYIFAFEEFNDINEVELFQDSDLTISKDKAKMPEGYYRFDELIGLDVIDNETGEKLGKIKEVLDYAPTKTLRISRENAKDFFVPFHSSFVGDIDFKEKTVKIFVVNGML